jgi:hypothetical protein
MQFDRIKGVVPTVAIVLDAFNLFDCHNDERGGAFSASRAEFVVNVDQSQYFA